jgi:hypothetical protein
MKPKIKSLKDQQKDGELGLIIDEMGRAMWNADKEYIARCIGITDMTPNMRLAMDKFQDYCRRHYGR